MAALRAKSLALTELFTRLVQQRCPQLALLSPAEGISRYLCGTPAVLSLAALECGVDTVLAMAALDCGVESVLAAEALGGMAALRDKSIALTEAFIALAEARCADLGVRLASPRNAAQRGSQVCLSLAAPLQHAAYPVVQALIARGVIGDFRAGDLTRLDAVPHILRFGFTPLYIGFTDVFDAVEHLHQVLTTGEWQEARFNKIAAVT